MISEEKAKEYLEDCNSKTDFAAKLGYSYYNGTVGDKVDSIFEEYDLDPSFDRGKKNRKYKRVEKECPVCEESFTVRKGHPKERKTCSRSCANKHFNHGNSEEAKKKKSESLKEYYEDNDHHFKNLTSVEIEEEYSFRIGNGGWKNDENPSCKIHSYKECKVCSELFVRASAKAREAGFGVERKTCSEECMIEAKVGERTYQNGSRKPEYYENPNTNEEVLLESSWEVEVAEKLDELNIEWERPDPIKWEDKDGDQHYYYPDFYLPSYDVYLDPKNPYCMDLGEEKMKRISEKVNIEYGSLKKINQVVDNVVLEMWELFEVKDKVFKFFPERKGDKVFVHFDNVQEDKYGQDQEIFNDVFEDDKEALLKLISELVKRVDRVVEVNSQVFISSENMKEDEKERRMSTYENVLKSRGNYEVLETFFENGNKTKYGK